MTTQVSGTSGFTFPDSTTQATAAKVGMTNRIINGAMVIDQRNAGASVTGSSTTNVFSVDRWFNASTQNSKITLQQNAWSVTPPAGFKNYVGVTSSSAYSVLTSDLFVLGHRIEGYNVADLGWGTANAQTITLSFWVRSSLTGTFGCCFANADANRAYPITYTISAANTWEQKTITIAGDTTGTWATGNTTGISVYFNLGAGATYSGTSGSWQAGLITAPTGAVSVVGTSGATFYITGVQLEKGSTATSFDYRPYGTELALCQRYYEKSYDDEVAVGTVTNGSSTYLSYGPASSGVFGVAQFKQPKRASPTVTTWDLVGNTGRMSFYSASFVATHNLNALASNWGGSTRWGFSASTTTAGAAGTYSLHWAANAEL